MDINTIILEACNKYEFDQLAGLEHLITVVHTLDAGGFIAEGKLKEAMSTIIGGAFPKNASAFRQHVNKLRGDSGEAKVSKAQSFLDKL